MAEAYIIDAVRTPMGKRGGGLSGIHPADLSAHVLRVLVERTAIDPAAVDDVVWGCVDTVGGQAGNIGRTGWLAAGFPEHVPGVTVDRQCGSSQQAVHFAAQAVLSGTAEVVLDMYLAEPEVSLKRFETVFPAAGSSNSAIEMTCEELERYSSNFSGWVDVCKPKEG